MKALVVRFSAIGDCVMTVWAVTALRRAVPDCEIVWAVQARPAPVIDAQRLAEPAVFPREDWKRARWSPRTWRDQLRAYTSLRRHRFDVGFDFQGHSKTALCLRIAGCSQRFSSRATDAMARRLCPPVDQSLLRIHEVERAYDLVLTAIPLGGLESSIMPDLAAEAAVFRAGFGAGPLATIQTGAGEADKAYPHWSDVAGGLATQGWTVVAVGGQNDPRLPEPAVDRVGRLDLRGAMAAVLASDVHLAADTGTGHVAAAYGVPVVSVFSKNEPERFRPYSAQATVLREGRSAANVRPEDVVEAAVRLKEARDAVPG